MIVVYWCQSRYPVLNCNNGYLCFQPSLLVANIMLTADGYELLWRSQLDSNPRSVEVCYTIKASYVLVVCQEDELNVVYLDSQNGRYL